MDGNEKITPKTLFMIASKCINGGGSTKKTTSFIMGRKLQ